MRITVTENGPYLVEGVPLVRLEIVVNEQGESVGYRELERIDTPEQYRLCRCGKSDSKPVCDYTHVQSGFDGTETAGHQSYLEESACLDGPGLRLRDVRRLCAEARFCDQRGGIWNLVSKVDDPEIRELVENAALLCPSGRYVTCDPDTDVLQERELEPLIALIEDPAMGVSGPLFVMGAVPIFDAQGEPYEVRNRATLCRCGESKNKPFCDGTHIPAGFRDESSPSHDTPGD